MSKYNDLGYSTPMGPQLRELVEQQLLADLRYYAIEPTGLKFDWSESCIEGHGAHYLDGYLENYSGICLRNAGNLLIVEGWMEFILAGDFFLAYWDSLNSFWLDTYEGPSSEALKLEPGIPNHIWQQIPADMRPAFGNERLNLP